MELKEDNNANENKNIKDSNLKIKKESEPEEDSEENDNLELNQEEDEAEEGQILKNNKNNNIGNNDLDDCSSSELDIDEDRLTLVQVRDFLKKKRLRKEKKNSLLQKKQKKENNITYDSNTKSMCNSFNPNFTELENFLKNCEVKEILNDDSTQSKNISPKNVFDPQEFMKSNNISKMSLSVEDLSLFQKKGQQTKLPPEVNEEKKTLIKPKMTEAEFLSTSMYRLKDKEHKEKAKEQFSKIRKIMSEDKLTTEQKIWLSEFINYINKLPLQEIIDNNKKFEIIFDLDNTCMYSYLGQKGGKKEALAIKDKYREKDIKIFQFEHLRNIIISCLLIRKGLKEFVEYIKDLCNFHISTLSMPNYGREAASLLENSLGIKFDRFSARANEYKTKKYITDLKPDKNFNPENVIIFDDSTSVWEKDCFNVIVSKKFYDKELIRKDRKEQNAIKDFLGSYSPYSYNRFKNDKNKSWKNQTIVNLLQCPFYQYKDENTPSYNESYFAEYLNSPKLQFIYMKNVIKVLYVLVFHNDVEISQAIKLVRLNALHGKSFYLQYLPLEQENILKDIVRVCGGDIYSPQNEDDITYRTKKVFLVATKTVYQNKKNIIINELKTHPNFILINERFILDSYYFMTDLGESYTDNEYTLYDEENYN